MITDRLTHLEKPENIRFGCLYTVKSIEALRPWANRIHDTYPSEQNYGLFLPYRCQETGEVFMIDTYHIDRCYSRNGAQEFMDDMVEKTMNVSSSQISSMRYDCYYNASVPLKKSNAECFYEVCFLPDYEIKTENEARNYGADDQISGIKLWKEHAYSTGGVTIVRKGAEKSASRVINAIINDIRSNITYPSVFGNLDKLEAAIERYEGCEYDHLEVEKTKEKFTEMKRIVDEWRAFSSAINEKYSIIANGFIPNEDEDECFE